MTEDLAVLGNLAGSPLAARGYEAAEYMGASMIRFHRGIEPLKRVVQPDGVTYFTPNPNAYAEYTTHVDNWLVDVEYRGLTPYLSLTYKPQLWTMPAPGPAETAFVNDFASFCGSVAQRYNGRILNYSVWNEPNNHVGGRGSDPTRGLDSYPELYNTMYRRCYAAIKAVNSNSKVYYGELDAHKANPCAYLSDSLWHATQTDGIAIHTYQWTTAPELPLQGSTECQGIGRLGDWNEARGVWSASGVLRTEQGTTPPLQITEHGYCISWGECPQTTGANRIYDEDERADLARRAFLWAQQNDVQIFSYYHLFNQANGSQTWDTGIVALDGAWTQSVYALRDAVVWPGSQPDFSGDGKPDVLARTADGTLWMYRGNRAGSWIGFGGQQVGAGWEMFNTIVAPGDFSGDARADMLARKPDGTLWLYRGNGAGSWAGAGQQIGAGWGIFDAIVAPGKFDGDYEPDVLARKPDGTLWLYRGNGAGSWIGFGGQQVGAGWEMFNAIIAPGDFSGDGKPDVLARKPDGTLWLYRGNGAGSWIGFGGQQVGAGWEMFDSAVAVGK